LYLGKKNGTHILGCLLLQLFSMRSSGTDVAQITNSHSLWRVCRASAFVKLSSI
jgi:hypothetical protein